MPFCIRNILYRTEYTIPLPVPFKINSELLSKYIDPHEEDAVFKQNGKNSDIGLFVLNLHNTVPL
jgi:hypothetical protein